MGTATGTREGLRPNGAETHRRRRRSGITRLLTGRADEARTAADFARVAGWIAPPGAGREAGAVLTALAALTGLAPADGAVLELIAVDRLSLAEAAAALGIGWRAARRRLRRARRALRAAPALARAREEAALLPIPLGYSGRGS
ncbi:sigma factor-like helix-turn-helix DNA-binding protein [Streptomyces litchfieldiae]|uniref:Sigma factor-like helix-turn-helix DNA-binding protein n=1 Tax=Streptomyces litchfieldiae TaxID=3075543 RepID=A0ABU2MKQ6_9ACTN|nr:sigma factor-like helix-turn-helix DNA-binding protein [Streptomyces sp. DSM 44938]MDT0341244.1 sigma factor-like helix-turn-helix DNA-binding protein [Streptomyces sp. DSM 44938]